VARDTSSVLLPLIPLQTHLRVSAVSSGAFVHVYLHQVAFAMDISYSTPIAARGLTSPTPHFGLATETSVPTLL